MGDYISREEAIERATRDLFDDQTADYVASDIKEKLNAVPAADVKPVIHAHWYVEDGCAYCSNCRNNFKKAILKEAKYCPKCGAQIDGYGGHPDAGPPTPYDLLYEEGGPDP